ncbi:threonine aldolase family protein [Halocalculus aciditolerans]|uniref:Threonine aldolase n=1 Tax=Halocalculus aciditolerans TaxID=1383812 RepID=A0A830EZ78_9EURY|nr:GntG family PLP-dependent aldolase [Halocalculus aciditolerans]GGL46780.1 threonine aldolase [Halocalculus aciditolerans]
MIDFRSDTVTQPSDAMRAAAKDAETGDDVYLEDPTVNALEAEAAELAGTEDALYVPSGTMGNQIAAKVHTEHGQEALVEAESHVYHYELGGFATHAGLQTKPYDGAGNGVPTPAQVHEKVVPEGLHEAGTGILCLENTHNRMGGTTATVAEVEAAADAAHEHGVPVHVDGARIGNAAVALGVDIADLAEPVDSVMFCLSKGLGAPVGSMLAGSEAFVEAARRERKHFGGGMRQAGLIAAPGRLALDNVDRLAEDHANARRLAAGLDSLDGLSAPEPDTNIVLVNTENTGMTAADFLSECEERDVLGAEFGDYTVRFCTHLDVDETDVDAAIDAVEQIV